MTNTGSDREIGTGRIVTEEREIRDPDGQVYTIETDGTLTRLAPEIGNRSYAAAQTQATIEGSDTSASIPIIQGPPVGESIPGVRFVGRFT